MCERKIISNMNQKNINKSKLRSKQKADSEIEHEIEVLARIPPA